MRFAIGVEPLWGKRRIRRLDAEFSFCPSCGLKVDEEDYEYESDGEVAWAGEMLGMGQGVIPPAGCGACGGPFPDCATSCRLFDD